MLGRTLSLLVIGAALAAGVAVLKPAPASAQLVIQYETEPPPRIYSYPHTRYEDEDVYYARGRWYYQRGPHWYYYHREPPPLRHYRTYVIGGPRHRGYHERGYNERGYHERDWRDRGGRHSRGHWRERDHGRDID